MGLHKNTIKKDIVLLTDVRFYDSSQNLCAISKKNNGEQNFLREFCSMFFLITVIIENNGNYLTATMNILLRFLQTLFKLETYTKNANHIIWLRAIQLRQKKIITT